jgi:hypothetical protein
MKTPEIPSAVGWACLGALVFNFAAAADEVRRSNWVPNVGDRFAADQLPLGDMWTFRCAPGGSFSVSVDTRDDNDQGEAQIDPVLEVVDGEGNNVAFADDERSCSFEPVCGFACPEVVDVPCGVGDRHSLIIRDFGTAEVTGAFCEGGGGYDVFLTVVSRDGTEFSEVSTEFGGGAFRQLPRWVTLRLPAVGSLGPVLDDEDVPNRFDLRSK